MEFVPFTEYSYSDDEPVGPLPLAAITPRGKQYDFYYSKKWDCILFYVNVWNTFNLCLMACTMELCILFVFCMFDGEFDQLL